MAKPTSRRTSTASIRSRRSSTATKPSKTTKPKKKQPAPSTPPQSHRDKENQPNANNNNNSEQQPHTPTEAPGVVSYWKVIKESGRASSPRLTRSSKKKRESLSTQDHDEQNDGDDDGGVESSRALFFSPPNQKANAAREKRERELDKARRLKRIEEGRNKGERLSISPPNVKRKRANGDDKPTKRKKEKANIGSSGGTIAAATTTTVDGSQSSTSSSPFTPARQSRRLSTRQPSREAVATGSSDDGHGVSMAVIRKVRSIDSNDDNSNSRSVGSKDGGEGNYHFLFKKLEAENARLLETIERNNREDDLRGRSDERIRELEADLELMRSQKAELENTIDDYKTQSEAQQNENATLKETITHHTHEISTHVQKSLALEKERDDLLSQTSSNTAQIQKITTLLEKSQEDAKRATSAMNDHRKRWEEKGGELDESLLKKDEMLRESEDTIRELEKALEVEKVRVGNMDVGLKRKVKMLEEAEGRVEEMTKKIAVLKEQEEIICKLSERGEEMEEELRQCQNDAAEVRNQLSDAQEQIRSLNVEIEKLYKEISDTNSLLEEVNKDKIKAEADLEHTAASLNKSTQRVKAEKELNHDLKSQLHTLNKNLIEADTLTSQLQNELQQTSSRLRNVTDERDAMKERMATFDEREERLKKENNVLDTMRSQLHNRVMQLVGNIRVFVRIRPTLPFERRQDEDEASSSSRCSMKMKEINRRRSSIRPSPPSSSSRSPFYFPSLSERASTVESSTEELYKNVLEVREPMKDRGGLKQRQTRRTYRFDRVFSPECGQDEVWEATTPLVQSAIDGHNVCIFAYGQTGSGKTYTMIGDSSSPESEGIIFRSIRQFFTAKHRIQSQSSSSTVKIAIELIEIYNEKVRDLLSTQSNNSSPSLPNLKIQSNDAVGNVIAAAESISDVEEILALAQTRRCVKATKSNAESSRSHMLFTMHFEVMNATNGTVKKRGKLHICDLAGSERVAKSGSIVGGSLLKEAQHINKSLMALSNVIEKLQVKGKQNNHVPYRDSKLTYLLQDSLGGDSKTLAFVCCNPLPEHYNESLCSIRFASKVNRVDLKSSEKFSC